MLDLTIKSLVISVICMPGCAKGHKSEEQFFTSVVIHVGPNTDGTSYFRRLACC